MSSFDTLLEEELATRKISHYQKTKRTRIYISDTSEDENDDEVPMRFPMKPPRNTNGKKTKITTNIRKIILTRNTEIFKYIAIVKYVLKRGNNEKNVIEVSNSLRKGCQLEQDKLRCRKVFNKALNKIDVLKNHGPIFYDNQGLIYTFSELKSDKLSFAFTEGISKNPSFIRAELFIQQLKDSFKMTMENPNGDGNLLNALSVIISEITNDSQNFIRGNDDIKYILDMKDLKMKTYSFDQGLLKSAVGIKTTLKTLEGIDGRNKPSIYMSSKLKTTLFHPGNIPLIDVMKSFNGFSPNLKSSSEAGQLIAKALTGVDFFLNYGPLKNHQDDCVIMKIDGFSESAKDSVFEKQEELVWVAEHFKTKYDITLEYPDLMTVCARGNNGEILYFPPEVISLCPSQKVTNERMINNEKALLNEWFTEHPRYLKRTTDRIVESIVMKSNITEFLKVEDPEGIEGIVLEKPTILYREGQYYEPKRLTNWEIAFVRGEDIDELPLLLMEEMHRNGMQANEPFIVWIMHDDLELVFRRAKMCERQLVFIVAKREYGYQNEIKCLEQKYVVPTKEIHLETALEMFFEPKILSKIINKTNIKLGGMNNWIKSKSFEDPLLLILGISVPQNYGEDPNYPITIGYAANTMDHRQKFSGGYYYSQYDRDTIGDTISKILMRSIKAAKLNRAAKVERVVIYLEGISEDNFSFVKKEYVLKFLTILYSLGSYCHHPLTIVIVSRKHNAMLYKIDQGEIVNLEPGTIIDHTIVSPVYNEFYHAGAAQNGTTKPTKYTVVDSSGSVSMENLQSLTHSLCYELQTVSQAISIPSPLFIAERCSERGAMILKENHGPIYTGEKVDLDRTNEKYGYEKNPLKHTRFNG